MELKYFKIIKYAAIIPLPLLCVKDGKDVLVGHEAFFHISDF